VPQLPLPSTAVEGQTKREKAVDEEKVEETL
jgi:hypothetical protein